MRLQDVLDEAIDILMHSEFKNFGNLQKARYQNNKTEDEIFLRHDLYANTVQDPKAVEKNRQARLKKRNTPEMRAAIEKGKQNRKNWYRNPENHKKFIEKIKMREQRNKLKKEIKKN